MSPPRPGGGKLPGWREIWLGLLLAVLLGVLLLGLGLLLLGSLRKSLPGGEGIALAFLDRVKLYQPPQQPPQQRTTEAGAGGDSESPVVPPIPRYLPDIPLRIRLELAEPDPNRPDPPEAPACQPLSRGLIALVLQQPDGQEALHYDLPLQGPWSHPVSSDRSHPALVVDVPEALPASPAPAQASVPAQASAPAPASAPAQASVPETFRFPPLPGLWSLSLTWHCGPSPQSPTRSRRWPIRVDLPPEQNPAQQGLWQAVRPTPGEDPLVFADRIEAQLRSDLVPETRLWLRKRQVQALLNAGAFARGEAAALDMAQAAEAAGFPSEAVLALNAAHEHAREQGHLARALEYLNRSLKKTLDLGFEARLPMEWYSQAVLLERQGEPLQAIHAASQAESAARRNRDFFVLEAATQLELQLLQALGYHEAVNQRLSRLLLAEGDDEPRGPAWWNNLGWIVLRGVEAGAPLEGSRTQALSRAAHAFAQALDGYKSDGDQPGVQEVQANLAGLAVLQGNAAEARQWLAQARELAPPEGELKAWMQRVEADVLQQENLQQEKSPLAFAAYQALEALGASDPTLAEYAGWGALGQGDGLRALAARAATPADKAQALEAATRAYDRAVGWTLKDTVARSPLHHATLLASRAIWEARAIEVRLEQGAIAEALAVAERGAWLRFSSQTAIHDPSPPPTPALSALRQRLESLENNVQALQRLPPSPERDTQLHQAQTLRETSWSELEALLRGPGWSEPPPLDVRALQSRLPPHGVLLRYLVLPESLVVWTVTRDRLSVRQEPLARGELEQAVERLTRAIQNGEALTSDATQLSHRLLGDVLVMHAAQTSEPFPLLLGVDGPLRALPWAALPWPVSSTPAQTSAAASVLAGRPSARRLIELASPQLVPSLFLSTPASTGDGLVVLADPARDLPGAAREGKAVQDALTGVTPSPVRLLIHQAATREALEQRLTDAQLLHFAGHGQSDALRPYLSHLTLARDQRFSLLDLRTLRLPGSLIFLNACEVGQASRTGGGVLGLSDGLLAAGAGAVVSSLWEVPDKAGAALASRFYQHLRSHWQTASMGQEDRRWSEAAREALAQAQRELWQTSAGTGAGGAREGSPPWAAWLVLGGLAAP